MFIRIITLIVGFLISMPIFSFGASMVSAADNIQVVLGFAVIIALIVAWYFGLRNFVQYVTKRFPDLGGGSNRHIAIMFIIVGGALSTACTTVEPGYVGIKVNSYGQNRGVQDYPIVTGRVTYNPFTEDIFQYPVFAQNVSWTHNVNEGNPVNEEISFNTGDQMVVFADISLSYELEEAKAPAFYVKFRADNIDDWTHGYLRNLTRQKFDNIAGKYKIEQIMGDNAPFLAEVKAAVQKDLDPFGVRIGPMGFNGSPRPPQAVIDAINAKVSATQDAIRVENELRKTDAEVKKRIATAEGEARSNEILTRSLSPTLLEWRRLEIQNRSVEVQNHAVGKWNGTLPLYTGGSIPLIQLPQGSQPVEK